MNLVIVIVIAALIVVVVIAAVIALVSFHPNEKKASEIHFLDGADVDSGRLSSDNNYFKGISGMLDDTVVVGGGEKKTSGITVLITNRLDASSWRLSVHDELTFGRESGEAAFCVRDHAVSKLHCKIFVTKGKLYLCDLGSTNHTYLNGRQLMDVAELKNGDIIRIGKTEFEISF